MRGRGSAGGDEFIREVDEAVRQDRWLQLWKQYGTYLIGAAVAIVVGSAAGVGWRTWQQNQRLDEARRFAAAQELLDEDQAVEAAAAFGALADAAGGDVAMLARLRAAEALGEAGDDQARDETLRAVAEDQDLPKSYRELADLLVIQGDLDTGDAAGLANRLAGLTGSRAPWRYSAMELQALAQMRAGDRVAARQTLDDLLADPTTPPRLAQRAAQLLAALGGPVETASADEGAAEAAR
jgi:hypothetical protein